MSAGEGEDMSADLSESSSEDENEDGSLHRSEIDTDKVCSKLHLH